MNSWLIHAGVEQFSPPMLDEASIHVGFLNKTDKDDDLSFGGQIRKRRSRMINGMLMKDVITRMINQGMEVDEIILETGASRSYVNHVIRLQKDPSERKERKGYISFPVIQYDSEGNFIKEFKNANQASQEVGVTAKHIRNVCIKHNVRKTAGGFIFKYKEDANG